MDTKGLERVLYAAFLHAATQMGVRVKGMSCFLDNWGDVKPMAAATAPKQASAETGKAA